MCKVNLARYVDLLGFYSSRSINFALAAKDKAGKLTRFSAFWGCRDYMSEVVAVEAGKLARTTATTPPYTKRSSIRWTKDNDGVLLVRNISGWRFGQHLKGKKILERMLGEYIPYRWCYEENDNGAKFYYVALKLPKRAMTNSAILHAITWCLKLISQRNAMEKDPPKELCKVGANSEHYIYEAVAKAGGDEFLIKVMRHGDKFISMKRAHMRTYYHNGGGIRSAAMALIRNHDNNEYCRLEVDKDKYDRYVV